MSVLKLTNYILQVFFIRVYRSVDVQNHEFGKKITTTGYGLLYFIIPFTGWASRFRFIGPKIRKVKFVNV